MTKCITSTVGWFKGKKTYAFCILTVLYAIYGYWKMGLSGEQAMQLIFTALIGAGIRDGIK